jgi:N,N-dimethylformamidase
MAALGWDRSSHYWQMLDAQHERAAFIMDGVVEDAPIGDFGLVGGCAAGHELDRYDRRLGTPPTRCCSP